MTGKPTYEELEARVQALEAELSPKGGIDNDAILLKQSVDNAAISIFWTSPEGRFLYVNKQASEELGYSQEELLTMSVHDIDPDYPMESRSEHWEKLKKAKQLNFKTSHRTKDGKTIHRELTSQYTARQGNELSIAFAKNISEQELVLEALRESEARYKSMFQENLSIIFIRDPETERLIDVNPAACSFFGYSRDEMIGMELIKITRGHMERIKQRTKETLTDGKNQFITRHYLANGEFRDVEIYNNAMTIKGKKAIISVIHDITERNRVEEALRESEQKYRRLYDEAPVGYMEFDNEGRITNVNKKELEMLGYTTKEMIGQFLWDFVPNKEESRKRVLGKLSGDAPPSEGVESVFIRKDGTTFPVLIDDFLVKDKDGRIIGNRSINRDITDLKQVEEENKRLEAQLRQAQKLEAVGTLAGGIAHDFNNILSPILINTEMALMDTGKDSPIHNNLQQVLKGGLRARDLVKQILAFSRQSKSEKMPFNVTLIVKEALKLLRSSLPTTIEIKQSIQAQRDIVLADPSQVHQILMNLCTNASHAMREKGGVLEIHLTDGDLDAMAASQIHTLKPGSYLRLDVRDTGKGMEPPILEKIFDPFFTTKGPGEGTGMGLSMVHGILTELGGTITVESEPGKGSVFHVFFPLADEVVSLRSPEETRLPIGTEHILLVDDENAIITAARPMLQGLGYKVTSRTSSIEALEAFRNKPGAFDLVITDMTMPNMTGDELAAEIMKIRPDMPVILCTGFSEKIQEKKALEMGIKAFIMKPIVTREMAGKIREVLGKRTES